MNVISVFRGKVASLLEESSQETSEKLIELATFFYKIDRRVSLEEQKYIDELLAKIEWNSNVSVEAYQSSCIAKINRVLEGSDAEIAAHLSALMDAISALGATTKAQTLAREIADADGEIADDEVKYLELVTSYE